MTNLKHFLSKIKEFICCVELKSATPELHYAGQVIAQSSNSNYMFCCLSQKKRTSVLTPGLSGMEITAITWRVTVVELKKTRKTNSAASLIDDSLPEFDLNAELLGNQTWAKGCLAADPAGKTPLCCKPQNILAFYCKSERSFWETPCYENVAKQRPQQNTHDSILHSAEVKNQLPLKSK